MDNTKPPTPPTPSGSARRRPRKRARVSRGSAAGQLLYGLCYGVGTGVSGALAMWVQHLF